jgi:formylglycine-generating enzyme required for sulfatase activity
VAENSNGGLHPTGRKDANAFGLHDMLGNAHEVCEAVPPGKTAMMGGGMNGKVWSCRCASRWEVGDALPWYRLGFRVAIIDPKTAPSRPTGRRKRRSPT